MSHTPGPFTITGPSTGHLKFMDDGGDYAIRAAIAKAKEMM